MNRIFIFLEILLVIAIIRGNPLLVLELEDDGIVETIDQITDNYYEQEISSVNFLTSLDIDQELMTKVIEKVSKKKMIMILNEKSLKKLEQDRLLVNIIITNSVNNFMQLIKNFNNQRFNYGGYYIILYKNSTYSDTHDIFSVLWDFYIYNVCLVRIENDTLIVNTFFPFKPSECNQTKPVEIARYKNNQFILRPAEFFPQKFNNFHKCSLNVTTFATLAPSVLRNDFPNGSYELYGRDVQIIKTLEQELNFTANVKYLKEYGSWGVLHANGTTTGAMGHATRRESEFAIGNLNLKYDRSLIMDYSFGYYLETLIFTIPRGQPYSPFTKLLRPFQSPVWISILITMLFTLIVIVIVLCNSKRVRNFIFGHGINYPILNVFAIMFGISHHKLPSRNFARYLLMSFVMFCLVIRSLYQGSLYQFLQLADNQPEVASIDEMAERNYTFYLIASYDDMTRENAAMKGKRKIIPPSELWAIMNKTLDVNFQGSNLLAISEVLYKNQLKAKSKEDLYTICKQSFTMIPVSIYYPKDSYLVTPFDEQLIWYQSSGLISHWISNEVDYKYFSQKLEVTEPKVMTLHHLIGTFQIWMILCFVSSFVFVLEVICNAGNLKIKRQTSVIRLTEIRGY